MTMKLCQGRKIVNMAINGHYRYIVNIIVLVFFVIENINRLLVCSIVQKTHVAS